MNPKIILAGGSGFLGVSLAKYLQEKNYSVVVLTRGKQGLKDGVEYIHWDGKTLGEWTAVLENAKSVINLTGKSVNCIYTKKNKEEIISSRLNSVSILDEAILKCDNPPESLIQAGSLAIFGNTKDECDEDATFGQGFSVDVCKQWENAFFKNILPETRKVLFRIGFVLGKDGGALEPLKKLAKAGLGGTVGSGKQYISWLHIEDLNRMFWESIQNKDMNGIYNATCPNPVTNKEFMKSLRTALNKGWAPPTPTPFVILGGYLVMRTAPELALTGRNCIPKRLVNEGFEFKHTDLEQTLSKILR